MPEICHITKGGGGIRPKGCVFPGTTAADIAHKNRKCCKPGQKGKHCKKCKKKAAAAAAATPAPKAAAPKWSGKHIRFGDSTTPKWGVKKKRSPRAAVAAAPKPKRAKKVWVVNEKYAKRAPRVVEPIARFQ
jgi:hypothetical protein